MPLLPPHQHRLTAKKEGNEKEMRLNTESKRKEEKFKQCTAGADSVRVRWNSALDRKLADTFLHSGKIKSWRRFCVERDDLSDKCAVVEVSFEPRLPSVEICAKRSLISNRCCRENRAWRVIQTSHTLTVS